jgi:hypothetical protein
MTMGEAEGHLAHMSEEWDAILASSAGNPAVVAEWEQRISSMRSEVALLREEGCWRGGYRTLMHALGIRHREVYLTAGLAWLLDPDGWHGLGDKVLRGLLTQLGLSSAIKHPVLVSTEETRSVWDTRADLIVRMPGVTLLVEAKVYAGEQPDQCDRLADAWAAERPTLVFLTLDGGLPRTAVRSAGRWKRLTWHQVTAIVETAAGAPGSAPGVRELLATLKILGK